MKLISEFKDLYLIEALYNVSLQNLLDEERKLIENFENYAVSKRKASEQIMRLQFMKFFNKCLDSYFYNITCLLSSEGRRSRKSVPRLVYSHFVEKLDASDKSHFISFKDNNRFHTHVRNLEKLSISEEHFKRVQIDRVQHHKEVYEKAIS